jgi:hypothetical protein
MGLIIGNKIFRCFFFSFQLFFLLKFKRIHVFQMPETPEIEYHWLNDQRVNYDFGEFLRNLNPQQNL